MYFMAFLSLKTACKIDRLYYKYRIYPLKSKERSPFDKILNSLWVVYPNWTNELRLLDKDIRRVIQTRYRWKCRVKKMAEHFGELYLLTLTFTDDVLNSTNVVSRRKYVLKWANEYCLDYIGCIDFGKQQNREHYHLIVSLDTPMTSTFYGGKKFYEFDSLFEWKKNYGFASCRPCYNGNVKHSLSYAFKSCFYALKSMDKTIKPFSKRNIVHFSYNDYIKKYPDSFLPYNPYVDGEHPYRYFYPKDVDYSIFQ